MVPRGNARVTVRAQTARMDETGRRHPAMCVVSVDDGPDGLRHARVSVQLDVTAGPQEVRRSSHTTAEAALGAVGEFLRSAGVGRIEDRSAVSCPARPVDGHG